MRNVKIVLSALALSAAIGGTALAADTAPPAGGTAQATTTQDHATTVKHKTVKHKKSGHKKSGAATAPAGNAAH
jgi:hypothetical protein